MPAPGEHKTAQARILAYGNAQSQCSAKREESSRPREAAVDPTGGVTG